MTPYADARANYYFEGWRGYKQEVVVVLEGRLDDF